ncbi:hypothetical protein GCM10009117_13910 [Gangjinia marincola]|uniref:Uncharacterized protein n=1 Tax=Gangjinia marincola TaxID=578463 RepID=A0ABP3XWL0_9FLAO
MSVLFLYLGFDELLRLHEKIGRMIEASFDTGGIFYYAWVIPYGIALLILGLIIVKPFLKLPFRFQKKFFLSGFIFVAGAVGLEMLSGWYIDFNQIPNEKINTTLAIVAFYTTEETLEMIGLSYFIVSLLKLKETYPITAKSI